MTTPPPADQLKLWQDHMKKKVRSDVTEYKINPLDIFDLSWRKDRRSRFEIYDEGLFSCTPKYHFEQMFKLVQSECKDIASTTVIDAFGCTGADSVHFAAKGFGYVYTYEYEEKIFEMCKHNIESTYFNNIELVQGDFYANFISNDYEKNVIVYMDPPWGGPDYVNYENYDIKIAGDNMLSDVIAAVRKKYDVFAKLPMNYKFSAIWSDSCKYIPVCNGSKWKYLFVYLPKF